jgi:hypothetical protein
VPDPSPGQSSSSSSAPLRALIRSVSSPSPYFSTTFTMWLTFRIIRMGVSRAGPSGIRVSSSAKGPLLRFRAVDPASTR